MFVSSPAATSAGNGSARPAGAGGPRAGSGLAATEQSPGVGTGSLGAEDSEKVGTGRCLVLVTPDAERTMATHLGVATTITPADVPVGLVGSAVFFSALAFVTSISRVADLAYVA